MTPRHLYALLLAAPLALVTAAAMAAAHEGDSGADLYRSACASCHASDGRGESRAQVGFDIPLPDFTNCSFATRETDEDWFAVIHEGGPVRGFDRMMPAFGEALSADQMQRILDHVRAFCADPAWPRGELNLPRTLFTEKAYPEDEAVFTSNVAVEGPTAITQELIWEKRFGPRSQVEVSVPFAIRDSDAGDGSEAGIGDVAIGIKHALHHSLEAGYILSVGGEIVLPTGDEARGLGGGTAVFEPFLLFGKALPAASFVQLHLLAEIPFEDGFEDEIGLRAALGKTWTAARFGRAWTPMIELLGARGLDGDAHTEWDAVPQLQVTLNTRQHILANLGVRLPLNDSSTRDTQIALYLLWDWYDGGLFDGW